MFVVAVIFIAKPDKAEAFRDRVRRQAAESLEREPGCHRFDVCADPEAPERIFLYELYGDEAAFKAHLETPHFKSFDSDIASLVEDKTVTTWALLD